MGLTEKLSKVAENLNLTEKVFVSVNVNRKRARPARGTALVEVLGASGETLALDTVKVPNPAPKGPWHINGKPTTFVSVGETGNTHQAFSCGVDESPFPLPEHILSKVELGAVAFNIWWSCEE